MNKPVYLIREFDLIGEKLFTYELQSDLAEQEFEVKYYSPPKKEKRYISKEDGRECKPVHGLFYYTTNLNKFPANKLFNASTDNLLPYFADVTEDLPSSRKWKPKTYKNCQLLSQKHGNYLEFFDHETKQTLRIAMNSNFYNPVVTTSK